MTNKNFTRKDLSEKVYKNLGFSKNLSGKIVDNFFEVLISSLLINEKIKLTSFGTFSVLYKKERIGRNPKTKVAAKIHPRKVIKFKASSLVRKKINKNG
tara:strand:- start:5260 stop:5556 length:297 start_codon:yes stop_codon:yes gene_type:complete